MITIEYDNLEALLVDDPDGVERDKLLAILQSFEAELDAVLKQGCAPADYKRVNTVLLGARIAQVALLDYHRYLHKAAEG